jgi:acetylornithine/succinyldiaminopimelate/putrescine aminotransferase
LEEEKLSENAAKMGEIVRQELEKIPKDIALEYRGRGLLGGLKLNPGMHFFKALLIQSEIIYSDFTCFI